jgi:hypothetical protein
MNIISSLIGLDWLTLNRKYRRISLLFRAIIGIQVAVVVGTILIFF